MEHQHRDITKHVTHNMVETEESVVAEDIGREKLKRHRVEVAGNVWVPEIWGQEEFLKDWIDCTSAFDASLVHSRITTAQKALVEEGCSSQMTYQGHT
ncbi:unnamed protein product [Lupinus luteus]|uniref:Uncharacterized protein n=1 Tax=Lupinus luteus TaxID=3873 RepID=A0AAV1WMH3_LUPLU